MAQLKRNRGRAFTLVELLVVIAIIALLIAILLPVLNRARRTALVLASPVAYSGSDGTVHLTDPRGTADVGIRAATGMQCPVCHSPPVWSPSGRLLAFRGGPIGGFPGFTVLAEPIPNRVKLFPDSEKLFLSWADDDHWYLGSTIVGPYYLSSLPYGSIHQTFRPTSRVMYISPAPPSAPGPYVGLVVKTTTAGKKATVVTFLKKDLSEGRNIWSYDVFIQPLDIEAPRVDSLGENVAWTQARSPGGGTREVAVKSVHDRVGSRPLLISGEFATVCFCDWTEGGDILANVSNDAAGTPNPKWKLVIYDRRGRLLRTLDTHITPARGSIASWRKYGHQ